MRVKLFAALSLLPCIVQAQRRPDTRPSTEVQPDRRIVFRLLAPKANEVSLAGELVQHPQPMQKDEKGIWSITVGPLDPAIYTYAFLIDGVRVIDPNNAYVQPGVMYSSPQAGFSSSLVEVPGEQPAFYDPHPVPHSTVNVRWYESKALQCLRSVYVYTPPNYEQSRDRYPVLYLLHGAGDNEAGWVVICPASTTSST